MYLRKYGPYQVEGVLGQGGAGTVLRGFHEDSSRAVALKVPKATRLQERQVLRREIGVLSRMNRAHIRGVVRVFDHGSEQGTPWYAMELLDGRSLRSWKEQLWTDTTGVAEPSGVTRTIDLHPAPLNELRTTDAIALAASETPPKRAALAGGQLVRALNVMLRIAEVLAQVHAQGVIHGDLTPGNILFRDELDPVLIDFGTSLAQLAPESFRELPVSVPWRCGTPGYLAPEVLRGELRDARCDLYAFGCILFELLTGSRPFSAAEPRDVLKQQLYATPPRLSERVDEVPAALEELVASLLAKDPLLRTPRALDVCQSIARLLPDQPKAFRETAEQTTLYRARLRGRDPLFAQLAAALEDVSRQRGGFVLLSGPSGIGKTRLMNEIAAAARRTDVPVIWCRAGNAFAPDARQIAVPSTGLELFSAVVEHLLEGEEDDAGRGLPASVLQSLHAVRRVAPPLAGGRETISAADGEPPALARSRAFDGLLALLKHIALPSGLLLLIDDVQWADELSAAFLRHYARAFAGLPILVIANYRTDAVTLEPDLDLASLADRHVALAALEPRDTERIAKDILASETLPAGLFAFLYKYSRGNPFYVAEYTRAAVESKLLHRVDDGWSFAADRTDEVRVPSSVEGLLELRVQRLSDTARRALQQASVLGSDFDAECFESLVSSSSDPTELLEELVSREILQVSSPARYRFAHDALREAQERTLSPEERRRYHALAAAQLERRGAEGQEGTLGYHWACAGEPERAIGHLERAAADARAHHTLERASELYRLAIRQCLLLEPEGEARERLTRLSEALADVLRQQARHVEARERLERIFDWLRPEQCLTRARVWRKLATSHWTVHDYPRASLALDEAEAELARRCEPPDSDYYAELIEVRLGRFEQLYFSGKVGPTLDALIDALAILLAQHGSNDQRCRYYFIAASNAMLKRRYAFAPDALALAERGLEAAVAVAPQRTAMARFILGYALMLGSRAQCQLALPHFETAGREAERLEEATLLSRIRTYHAITALRVGDTEATAVLAELALEAASEAHLQPYLGAARACQGWVAWRKGDARRSKELLEAGRECWRGSAHGFPFSNLALFPLIDLACSTDDFETARVLLEESNTGLPALPETLCGAIRDAILAIDQAPPLEASNALGRVVRVAQELAFA